jgi:hypothetical protein
MAKELPMFEARCNLFCPRSGVKRRPGFDPHAGRRDYRISKKAALPQEILAVGRVFWERRRGLEGGWPGVQICGIRSGDRDNH